MFDGGRKLSVGDCALFQAGNAPPFIGILRKLTPENNPSKYGVNWLYRPADVKLAKGGPLEAAPNEIFYSFHKDEISAASLLHPCKVAFLRKGTDLPAGVSSFVCRRVYDTANKCLWWLTDRDYTDEHQDEVDLLLERTKLEMQAAVQSGGPSPRALTGPTSSQQLKSGSEVVQNATFSAPSKSKKRERTDQNLEPSKRERSVKTEDGEVSPLKRERSMKPEEIASITEKDGGLLNPSCVERLLGLMQQDRNDGIRKASDVTSRRTILACVIAATEREDCLNQFVQLGGLPMLDDWLQEAHKGKVGDGGSPKEGDKGVEELLLTLLKALDKLPVDLDALKTCSVGKSVNHLRSHKNLEIQKKARKLVDIWKKRVDVEMKLSGELKSPNNHGIWSSSYKQNSPDMMHSHLMKSGVTTEVAVKSSGAFAGSAKPMPNGNGAVESISKLGSGQSSGGKISNMLASATGPVTKRDESGSNKSSTDSGQSDVALSTKEEKNVSTLQAHTNGQNWGNGQQGKTAGSSSWKDDVKNGSLGGPIASKPMGTGSRHPSISGKGLLGTSLTSGSKEILSGKPLVWSRPTVTDKISSGPSLPVEKGAADVNRDISNPQHRLIVRIPNPGRSPARMTGGTFEQTPPGSRGLSPNVPERSPTMSLDVDVKGRVQTGNQGSMSPEANGENKNAPAGRQMPGVEDEREKCITSAQSDVLTDGEKRGEESTRSEADRNVKEFNEQSNAGGFVQRSGLQEGQIEVDDGKAAENSAGSAGPSTDVCCEPIAMEVDDRGMSLLATVAASEISRTGTNATMHERSNVEEISVDQDRGSRVSSDVASSYPKASEIQHVVKESHDGNDQSDLKTKQDTLGNVSINGTDEVLVTQIGEGHSGKTTDLETKEVLQDSSSPRRDVESKDGERRLSSSQESGRLSEPPCGSGVLKPPQERRGEDRHIDDLERESALLTTVGSVSSGPVDGHIGKPVKKNTSELKSMQSMELCSGYGSNNSNESKSFQSLGYTDAECKPEDSQIANEAGQTFGLKISDQEDVLEVARQVEKEVEQMERFGKSAAMSTEKIGQDVKSPGYKASEMRDVNYSDAGRESHRWKSHTSLDLDQDAEGGSWPRNTAYSAEERGDVSDRLEQTNGIRSTVAGEAETDLARCVSSGDRRAPASGSDTVEAALDASQELKRRVLNAQALGRIPPFQSSPMSGLSNPPPLTPGTPSHFVKPTRTAAGDPNTPDEGTENGPSDGGAGGSDVSERPDFDLNEGFSVEESPQDDCSTSPVAPLAVTATSAVVASSLPAPPIAIVTATKGGFVLPASPMRTKSELGWKGSAATSAFRPAEPRRTPERQPSAGESLALEVSTASTTKKVRPPLDLNIDLNEADDRSFEENSVAAAGTASSISSQGSAVGLNFQAPLPSATLSGLAFQSDHSSGGQQPPAPYHGGNFAARPILDLNMLDESEESGTLLNMDARVSHAMVPSARSNNSSSSLPSTRPVSVVLDFDLNDGPSAEDGVADDQPALPLLSARNAGPPVMLPTPVLRRGLEAANGPWYPPNNVFKPAMPDFSSTRAEAPYSIAAAAAAQSYMSAGAGGVPFNGEMYRACNPQQALVFTQGSSVPPPLVFSQGLSVAPSSVFTSGGPVFTSGGPVYTSGGSVFTSGAQVFTSGAQVPYPYGAGFPIPSGFPYSSTATFNGNNGPPYHDSTGSVSFPVASSGAAVHHVARPPPYMMGISDVGSAESGNVGWSGRPSLDLNAGPESGDGDGGREDIMNMRQMSMMGGQPSMDQMRVFRQVVVNAPGPALGPPMKRKEPESGWGEMNRSNGYKQQTWR